MCCVDISVFALSGFFMYHLLALRPLKTFSLSFLVVVINLSLNFKGLSVEITVPTHQEKLSHVVRMFQAQLSKGM